MRQDFSEHFWHPGVSESNTLPYYSTAEPVPGGVRVRRHRHSRLVQIPEHILGGMVALGRLRVQESQALRLVLRRAKRSQEVRHTQHGEADAKAVAAYGLPLPQLAELRRLGQNLGELPNLYRQAGDEASAQATLQMGVPLGRQVGEPSGQNYLISDLVGLAIERQILERMDPAKPYESSDAAG